jgi:hypothetical protein
LPDALGVVKPGLVAGVLLGGEQAGAGFAVDLARPLDVGAVQLGWVGFAAAAGFAAAGVADLQAAGERDVDLGDLAGELAPVLLGRGLVVGWRGDRGRFLLREILPNHPILQ